MLQQRTQLTQALIASQAAAAAAVPVDGGGARGRRSIYVKALHRLVKFGKGKVEFKEFAFDLGVMLGSESPGML